MYWKSNSYEISFHTLIKIMVPFKFKPEVLNVNIHRFTGGSLP